MKLELTKSNELTLHSIKCYFMKNSEYVEAPEDFIKTFATIKTIFDLNILKNFTNEVCDRHHNKLPVIVFTRDENCPNQFGGEYSLSDNKITINLFPLTHKVYTTDIYNVIETLVFELCNSINPFASKMYIKHFLEFKSSYDYACQNEFVEVYSANKRDYIMYDLLKNNRDTLGKLFFKENTLFTKILCKLGVAENSYDKEMQNYKAINELLIAGKNMIDEEHLKSYIKNYYLKYSIEKLQLTHELDTGVMKESCLNEIFHNKDKVTQQLNKIKEHYDHANENKDNVDISKYYYEHFSEYQKNYDIHFIDFSSNDNPS